MEPVWFHPILKKENTLKRLIRYALPVAALSPTFALAGLVCIVHKENPLESAPVDKVRNVFLGKAQSVDNSGTLLALDVEPSSAVRKTFTDKIVEKNDSELSKYWSRLVFTGKGTPPKKVGGDDAVIKMVSENKNALGCVDDSKGLGSVKVILKNN